LKRENDQESTYIFANDYYTRIRVGDVRSKNNDVKQNIMDELRNGMTSKELEVVDDAVWFLSSLDAGNSRKVILEQIQAGNNITPIVIDYLRGEIAKGSKEHVVQALELINNFSSEQIHHSQLMIEEADGTTRLNIDALPQMLEQVMQNRWCRMLMGSFALIRHTDKDLTQVLNVQLQKQNNIALRYNLLDSSQYWADYSSIPALMSVLPEEVDPIRQYICLRTLNKLTGRKIPSNYNLFEEKRDETLKDWAAWWKTEGAPAFGL